ncbi:MAG: hypothetical protein J6Q94_09945 [Clostridia bacterium]|nr:hypothetical protein [Clostridia bacterium]
MRKISKSISCILSVILLVLVFTSTAFATQSNYDKFDTSAFSLTDNPGEDMAAIALAQLGKTGSDLNYSEEWCADFVGDCAIIIEQSTAVPLYGAVEGLYTKLLDAGATEVTDEPVPGDLVFINWDGAERKGHIEIVYDYDAETKTVFTVGGNTGDYDSYYERHVGTHEIILGSDTIKAILRPDYNDCSEHSYLLFSCTKCGELHPAISSFINQIKAFFYSLLNMLKSL